ncbi:hypothetical protein GLOTRDRAFT_68700 [Gloeophyllum trabeum ATCC 11539]|uniref:Metallo-beta-lactamase domain-containing protein n=1 Tax=Gloeophyllum trabeum (strain ATCC 11539 / FP-39264 / Madison 617) TaxID=670483 RepID=S7S097_GLOTA|nr:uncharacterized protein GLOTRDRAFT_68700 [Gloeophyllum trabeum ATCC 11539]EPQ60770.1 hypothetical protein GLOTRDRAFT_68700 [Gloeophyllum trabeum ATCC 11539]
MSQYINVTFLGTSSGGGPSESRNCSSLVVDMMGDGTLWMVDCAEGTVRQFTFQPRGAHGQMYLRSSRVTRVFITHMHADHTMGLITLIRNVLRAPPTTSDATYSTFRDPKRIDIYGPRGIRQFVRTIISVTHTRSHPEDFFVVHELLMRKDWAAGRAYSGDAPMPDASESEMDDEGEGEGVPETRDASEEPGESEEETEEEDDEEGEDLWEEPSAPAEDGLHPNELAGRDIRADKRHFWRKVVSVEAGGGEVSVDAGPIIHRDPCIGYVFTALPSENPHPSAPPYAPRKLVILGDTSDPAPVLPLCRAPPPSLLVHEATDAYIPTSVDPQSKRSRELVAEKCVERGHSTPEMAGAFARRIGAKRLVLNHLGARFPAPLMNNGPRIRGAVLREMERQASEAWGGGTARAALDFTKITIPPERLPTPVHALGPEMMVLDGGDSNDDAPANGDGEAGGSNSQSARGGWGRGRGRGGERDVFRGRGGRKRELDAVSPGGSRGGRSRSQGGRSQSGHSASRSRSFKKAKELEDTAVV